jgi:hypothetical protein
VEGEATVTELLGSKAIQAALQGAGDESAVIDVKHYNAQYASSGVLIQVIGWLNTETSSRKFCQTFFLVRQVETCCLMGSPFF